MNCERPDRDVPGIVCGYPLPCPHHTVVIEEGSITFPKTPVDSKTVRRLADIADALKGFGVKKERE